MITSSSLFVLTKSKGHFSMGSQLAARKACILCMKVTASFLACVEDQAEGAHPSFLKVNSV